MCKDKRSLAIVLGTAVGVGLVGIAAIMYARSRSSDSPIRTVQQALVDARDKIREIEQKLQIQQRPA